MSQEYIKKGLMTKEELKRVLDHQRLQTMLIEKGVAAAYDEIESMGDPKCPKCGNPVLGKVDRLCNECSGVREEIFSEDFIKERNAECQHND